MRIFHLTTAGDWAQAQRSGGYTLSTRGRTLDEEGYIHCSEPHQVEPVRGRYYDGVPDLLLLEVETDLLTAPWRFEQLPGMTEAFPHVYGPIDLAAVVGVRPL